LKSGRGDHVHQGPALQAGEDRRIDLLGQFLVIGQDQPAAWAAQRLVGRRRHDVSVRERVGILARHDQAGIVGHVAHQQRADFVGDLAELLEIDLPRISRAAGDDHLRLLGAGDLGGLVIVDQVILDADAIGHGAEPLA
jgi:hypothetical protein